jgi:arsenate reductase
MTHIAFVCVQNAGRSQIATAFAEREREKRGLEDITIHSGGTYPADTVHDIAIEIMDEEGIDLSENVPQEITTEELKTCEYVATMGCSTLSLPSEVDVRDWDLDDPYGLNAAKARKIREKIKQRVTDLFDELEMPC